MYAPDARSTMQRGHRLNSARHSETRDCFGLYPHVLLIDPSINTASLVPITYTFSQVPVHDATFVLIVIY